SLRIILRTEEEEKQARVEDKLIVTVTGPSPPPGVPAAAESDARLTVEAVAVGEPEIAKLFRAVIKYEGSDLHLVGGIPPMMRLRNVIRQMEMPPVTQEEMVQLVDPILSERSRSVLEETGGADFAYVLGNKEGRFRVNLFKQRGQLSLVARQVNAKVPTFEK